MRAAIIYSPFSGVYSKLGKNKLCTLSPTAKGGGIVPLDTGIAAHGVMPVVRTPKILKAPLTAALSIFRVGAKVRRVFRVTSAVNRSAIFECLF